MLGSHPVMLDIAIVGAGPCGLFSVFQAGLLGMNCVVIDSLGEIGGQCTLYANKPIYDIPGHPMITAEDLVHNLHRQSERFKPHYILSVTVTGICSREGYVELFLEGRDSIKAKAVILAVGRGKIDYNKPPIPGIENYEGESVHYRVKDSSLFYDRPIAIAGGGDSAIDWVIEMAERAKKIYLVHRRSAFRCVEDSLVKLKKLISEGIVDLIAPYQVKSLYGEGNQLHSIGVTSNEGDSRVLNVAHLLLFFGLKSNLSSIAKYGVKVDGAGIEVAPSSSSTSMDRVYAIGDAASYEGKIRLILTGFSEAAQACYHIRKVLFSHLSFNFQYSTNAAVFTA